MSFSIDTPLVGIDVPPAKIESTLRNLWRIEAELGGENALLKTSTLNLVILGLDESRFVDLAQAALQVSNHHPSRVIIVYLTRENGRQICARVSVLCHISSATKKQLTGELIQLQIGAEEIEHLPGIVLPSLLPNLPRYLYVPDGFGVKDHLFFGFDSVFDRTIIDSERHCMFGARLHDVLDHIENIDQSQRVLDLTWARMTPWREAVAQFFDHEPDCSLLNRLSHMTVLAHGNQSRYFASLFIAWIASRLKWEIFPERDRLSIKDGRSMPITLAIEVDPSHAGAAVLRKVELIANSGEMIVRYVAECPTGHEIVCYAQEGDEVIPHSTLRLSELSESKLLCEELDFIEPDKIYIEAIRALRKMEMDR